MAVRIKQSTLKLSSQQMSAPFFLSPSTKLIWGVSDKRSVTFPSQECFSILTGACKRQWLVWGTLFMATLNIVPSHWGWYFRAVLDSLNHFKKEAGLTRPFTSLGNLADEPSVQFSKGLPRRDSSQELQSSSCEESFGAFVLSFPCLFG